MLAAVSLVLIWIGLNTGGLALATLLGEHEVWLFTGNYVGRAVTIALMTSLVISITVVACLLACWRYIIWGITLAYTPEEMKDYWTDEMVENVRMSIEWVVKDVPRLWAKGHL